MDFAFILLIIAIPSLVILLIVNIPRITRLEDLSAGRFICPHCGKRFRVKWYRLLFSRWQIEATDKAPLICPECGAHDLCGREASIYEDEGRV